MIEMAKMKRLARLGLILLICTAGIGYTVTSRIVKESDSKAFLKGETENIVVSSRGTLELSLQSEVVADGFEDIWSINQIVTIGNDIYLGSSPNGGIYKYSMGEVKKIYPIQKEQKKPQEDANQTKDTNDIEQQEYLLNEHIFAMEKDISGRLLAGISGDKCRLMRLEGGEFRTVFEPNDANYIFSIEVAADGNIYIGTGSSGKIYQLDSLAESSRLVYDSEDKNILSLDACEDGFLYAGSDTRGLVYKINLQNNSVNVLYDTDYPEVTSVISTADGVYAAGTSAMIKEAETEFAANNTGQGRPESENQQEPENSDSGSDNPVILKLPNSSKKPSPPQPPKPPRRKAPSNSGSKIYKIDAEGFVETVFEEQAVFFCMQSIGDKLIIGTGGNGQLFKVDPKGEIQKVIYDDPNASQITALKVLDDNIYLGTANPARLIKIYPDYSKKGTYTSDLIDAEQPAKWGMLQVDGQIPSGCEVLMACRSGNVKDVNAPTFSDWTDYKRLKEPVLLDCPTGRFCQYKLVFKTDVPDKTPVIKEVSLASTIPNIAPKILSVSVETVKDKPGTLGLSWEAEDDNSDKLTYKIDFRQTGWDSWIELEEDIEENKFLWDSRTVQDGRYEIRITANDRAGNSDQTALTASRVSEQLVIDNTPPVIENINFDSKKGAAVCTVEVSDELSIVEKIEYTIDSSKDWKSSIPKDLVYDTTEEVFVIELTDLKPGEHILSLKLTDAAGNTAYKNIQF
jgi:hypothetical protein